MCWKPLMPARLRARAIARTEPVPEASSSPPGARVEPNDPRDCAQHAGMVVRTLPVHGTQVHSRTHVVVTGNDHPLLARRALSKDRVFADDVRCESRQKGDHGAVCTRLFDLVFEPLAGEKGAGREGVARGERTCQKARKLSKGSRIIKENR